jgi:hypothetical protein
MVNVSVCGVPAAQASEMNKNEITWKRPQLKNDLFEQSHMAFSLILSI